MEEENVTTANEQKDALPIKGVTRLGAVWLALYRSDKPLTYNEIIAKTGLTRIQVNSAVRKAHARQLMTKILTRELDSINRHNKCGTAYLKDYQRKMAERYLRKNGLI